MDALVIKGPCTLSGTVTVSGSKNTALPLLFSSILFEDEISFENVPRLWDIETTLHLLREMGAQFQWDKEAGTIQLRPTIEKPVAPYDLVRRMRAGILALGPLLARCGRARVSLPGGCAIGARPVNFHIDAMKKMGVEIEVESGYIVASIPKRLMGTTIQFPQVTVTGTENLMMLAAVAEGETLIENAAREPEVVHLGEFLQSVGASIQGLGESTLRIRGGQLSPPTQPVRIPPDRIETGTFISAALATRSPLKVEATAPKELAAVLQVFREMGAQFEIEGSTISVIPAKEYRAIDLTTEPYPGFPTDMQAQLMVNLCLAEGESTIHEQIFENRFMHVAELRRLGAEISTSGNEAKIKGPVSFRSAEIMATDLRASASLVLGALVAKGETVIRRIYHLDRGYERLDKKLNRLGAAVRRISDS